MPASKLALALVEEQSIPLNFLYFSTQLSLKTLAKQRKTAKKCLRFTVTINNNQQLYNRIESVAFKAR